MTLKTVYISIGFLAGLFLSFFAGDIAVWSQILLLALSAASLLLSKAYRLRILLISLSFAVGVLYNGIYSDIRLKPLEAMDGRLAEFEGKIVSIDYSDRGSLILEGTLDGKPCKVVTYLSGVPGELCDRVSFTAGVHILSDGGFFNERSTYIPDGIFLRVDARSDITVTPAQSYTLGDRLRIYSRQCSDVIREYAGGDEGDLLTAMSTGDDSHMTDSLRTLINRTGIGHVTSVSGVHVSVTSAFVMILFKRLGIHKSFCCAGALIPVVAYVVFSGADICAIRSALMMAVYIFSVVSKRRFHPLNTLALCALMITAMNPFAVADMSFILSLSGVFAVSILAPEFITAFNIKSKIGMSFATSFVAWIATLPVLMIYFDEISLVAPFMNMTLGLCSVSLILTLLFVLLGCPPMLSVLPKAAGLLIKPILWLCRLVSDWELCAIPVLKDSVAVVAIFLILVYLTVTLFIKLPRAKIAAALMAVAIFMSIYSVTYPAEMSKLKLDLIYSGKQAVALLRKSDECIIIDINNGTKLVREVSSRLARSGVDSIPIATSKTNGEVAYTAYSNMLNKPSNIYLPRGTYIYQPKIPVEYLGGQTAISFADCELILTDKGAFISAIDGTYSISNGIARGGDVNLSFFDGVVVVNGRPIVGTGTLSFELN